MPHNQIAHSGNFGLTNNSADVADAANTAPQSVQLKQNWVLDPVQDTVFIIAAPLISLALAVLAMHLLGAGQGAALIITAHIVMTVAHHMPTFIRIYGDVDLFQRFKWSFVLGPLVPMVFAAAVLAYINANNYPVEYFLYLYIFLSLWDPWHFLRQHFGFMRIYDRNNAAPAALASNMDWAICGIWFLHVMVASADWVPGLLEDLYRNIHFPLLLHWPEGFLDQLQTFSWWLAVLATAVYSYYLFWCGRQGYYISKAKIGLLVCTFGVMYLTYTPNEFILQLVPAWGFKVGFATLGIVHMTQYMAIVWRYDSRIAQQGRARGTWFAWLHGRRTRFGIAAAAAIYVLFCLAYGDFITSSFDNRWLMSVLLAVGFTSTLMHYYFDGFIWKMRHSQNRSALGMESGVGDRSGQSPANGGLFSWWTNTQQLTVGRVLLRQLIYFGVPMGLLTFGALAVWNQDQSSYVQHMYQAQTFSQQGRADAAAESANKALAAMQAELPLAQKLVQLKASAANEAQLAFVVYNESLYANLLMPNLAGKNSTPEQQRVHASNIRLAADLLISAVGRGGDPAHPGREQLSREQAQAVAQSWLRQLQ